MPSTSRRDFLQLGLGTLLGGGLASALRARDDVRALPSADAL